MSTLKSFLITFALLSAPAPPARGQPPDLVRQLQSDIRERGPEALAGFWRSVEQQGTPLVEQTPSDSRYVSCTFLWRGDAQTRSVLVYLPPYTRLSRDAFQMSRVDGTDVWFVSVNLPAKSRLLYQIAVNPPAVMAAMTATPEQNKVFRATVRLDPFNPRRWPEDAGPATSETFSVIELPGAEPQLWLTRQAGVPQGKLERRVWKSSLLDNERTVAVYTPPGYASGNPPAGLLVLFDGGDYTTKIPVPVILDNLLAAGRIPPLVAVFIGNAAGARPYELPCNVRFAEFVHDELMPWVRKAYNVVNTPQRTIIGGSSYGGLAATCTALKYPETFGNVLSQSGSYWWTPPPDPRKPFAFDLEREPNYIASMFITRSRLPLRFYLEAGIAEISVPGQPRGVLDANRYLRDVLLAKGYEVQYREFAGGHGALSWRGTFPDALLRTIE
ncbi:MAG: enterochelin esterase, partial [Bryobacteraceae bacterium]|nr:enterochelin esterase [Bryobacteraceae bacterium]